VRRIHHVGVAVADMESALSSYRVLLHAEVAHQAVVDAQGVHAVALRFESGPLIELLAATAPDTPVGRFLAKRGPGLHHVAYEVRGIDAELARLAAAGVQLIDSEPRAGLFGLQVAFIHPDSIGGVLVELVEPKGAGA
jgi:methylmalonyl-CoA/ethylmalonyl-CoA epimerase